MGHRERFLGLAGGFGRRLPLAVVIGTENDPSME
jgi:hypothetical protein